MKMAVVIALSLGVALLGRGQVASEQAPVEVVQLGINSTKAGPVLSLKLTNKSAKPIVAYALVSDLLNEAGAREVQRGTSFVRGLVPGGPATFAPGESWSVSLNVPLRNGKPAAAKVLVDYVLFGDRSSWGRDRMHLSQRVAGVIEAFRVERARLKRILRDRGMEAVAVDLNTSP